MLKTFIVRYVNLLNTSVYQFQPVTKRVLFLSISFTVIFGVLRLFLIFLGQDGLFHLLMTVLVLPGFFYSSINQMLLLFSQIFAPWLKINLESI
uniref:Retrovirus-related Pol polyprotein from transposon TNT 1-94 n=1 Tax=Rhizophora mucronata TaxID=61149 RepID=A0A2P2MWT1_RHIMU